MDNLVHRESLHPPTHGTSDDLPAESSIPDWILLEFRAYFADRRNSTTASCKTRDGKEIQVTFFPAHRPRLSYFCVHCHGVEPSGFVWEPKAIATGGPFVLLRVSIGHHYAMVCPSLHEFFVYRAGGGSASPSLELLPHPGPYFFYDGQVGLISRGTEYTLAALRDSSSGLFRSSYEPGHYDVSILHSEDKVWTARDVFLPPEQQEQHHSFVEEGSFCHKTSKAITLGGEGGTMAFVDLWNGILLYDVFSEDPVLRYVPMPQQLLPSRRPNGSPWITRDVAVVKDRIKLVQVLMRNRPDLKKASHEHYTPGGWAAATWSRMASFPQDDSWSQDFELDASDIDGDNNPMHSELLKRLPDDEEGKPRLSLERLYIGHPTISLDNDDVVYFMINLKNKAWVLDVDMRYRMLRGVAEFGSERTFGLISTYTQSRISKHLNMSRGTEGNLKRPGMQLPESCSKKLFGISSLRNVDDVEATDDMLSV